MQGSLRMTNVVRGQALQRRGAHHKFVQPPAYAGQVVVQALRHAAGVLHCDNCIWRWWLGLWLCCSLPSLCWWPCCCICCRCRSSGRGCHCRGNRVHLRQLRCQLLRWLHAAVGCLLAVLLFCMRLCRRRRPCHSGRKPLRRLCRSRCMRPRLGRRRGFSWCDGCPLGPGRQSRRLSKRLLRRLLRHLVLLG